MKDPSQLANSSQLPALADPMDSRALGKSATEECSRTSQEAAQDRSSTSPASRKHAPSPCWYQLLCAGLETHILTKPLHILLDPDVSLDLPSVHHPHWREGVGDMKALSSPSPWHRK